MDECRIGFGIVIDVWNLDADGVWRNVARLGGRATLYRASDITRLFCVWMIDFSYSDVSDEDLVGLWGLTERLGRVRELVLAHTRITDKSVARLGVFRGLWKLDLSGCAISGDTLSSLGGLSELKVLDVSSTGLSARGIDELVKLDILAVLRLKDTRPPARKLARLGFMKSLVSSDVSGTAVDDDAVLQIARCPTLEMLIVKDTRVTAAMLREMRHRRPGLKVLR